MGDTYDVIMAAYPAVEAAQKDFDALVALVESKKVRTEGVILVERAADGEVHVSQTGDHLGRKGLGWGGGVGVLVGLAAPPLLASVAVGAAAGGLVGKFMHHKVESGMESGLGEKLKPGTAAMIAMVDDEDRLAAERALPGTPAKSVVAMERRACAASRTRSPRRRSSSSPTGPSCRFPTRPSAARSAARCAPRRPTGRST